VTSLTSPARRDWDAILRFVRGLLLEDNPETLRQIHYRIVSDARAPRWGYDNTQRSYKALSAQLVRARWDGVLHWDWIVDETRRFAPPALDCESVRDELDYASHRLRGLLTSAPRPRISPWAWQPRAALFLLEKNALASVLRSVVQPPHALAVCRGFASASYLYRVSRWALRVCRARELHLYILTDHDPSGHSIAESAVRTLEKHGVRFASRTRLALTREQIRRFNLPGVPAKRTDSRTRNWAGGDVVELDALPARELRSLVAEVQGRLWESDVAEQVERLREAVNRRAAHAWERERRRIVGELL